MNQVIVYDKIIKNVSTAKLKLRDQHVKFGLIDQGAELRNRTIPLKLMWDHMPITTSIVTESQQNSTHYIKFPSKYKNN